MKLRLDKLLVLKELAPTRHKAQALIGAGHVRVNGHPVDKAGSMVADDSQITVKESLPFVSRGGLKIARALEYFDLQLGGYICADIGASTGGFTDCLLQNGAVKVYSVDVGYGQLAWKLRQDGRVVVMERTNARHLAEKDFADKLDLSVIDASFISLKLLLPPLLPLFDATIRIIALIKPQFEVGKGKVGKGGVVRDETLHEEVIRDISDFTATLGLDCKGVVESPIHGPKGNKEFLIYLTS